MKRLSLGEKSLLALTPLLFLIPFGVSRWQQVRAARAPIVVWEHTGSANSVAFSPDSLHLVSAGGELNKGPEVRVWNLVSKGRDAEFKGQGVSVMSLEARFSPDGTRVLGIKGDGVAEQWSWPGGTWIGALGMSGTVGAPMWRQSRTPNGNPGVFLPSIANSLGRLMSADYSPDGQTIISCGYMTATNALWNANTGALKKEFASNLESFAGVRFCPDNKHFLSVRGLTYSTDPAFGNSDPFNVPAQSGVVHLWDAQTAKRLGKLPLTEAVYACWSPDGTRVAIVHKVGTMKRQVSNSSGQTSLAQLPLTKAEVWKVNFSASGVTSQKLATMSGTDLIIALDWSPDGTKLVGYRAFSGATIWSAKGQELGRFDFAHQSLVGSGGPMTRIVAWSPDGKWIAAVNGPHVELWNAAAYKPKP